MRADLAGYASGLPITSPVQRSLIVKTFPGFAALAGSELAVMATITRERIFRRGEVMLEPGRPVTAMYLVVEGRVQTYVGGKPSQELGPKSAVGGLAALTRDPQGAHIVALEDVLALEIDPEDMQDVFEDNFGIVTGVLGALARTLRDLQRALGGGAAAGSRDFPDLDTTGPMTLVDKMFCLTRSTNFEGASIEALAELADGAYEMRVPAGEALWRRGSSADYSLMIVSGEVMATPENGEPFTFRSGWVVGGLDSLGREPRWYDLEAATDLVALRLRRAILFDVLEDHPDMAIELLRGIARGITAAIARVSRQTDSR